MAIYFGNSVILAEGTNSDIDTVEEDIVSVSDLGKVSTSQLSMSVDIGLGTHSALNLHVYVRYAISGAWVPLTKRDISTGIVEEDFWQFNSDSPTIALVDLPLSACVAVKVTGQGIGGLNGSATIRLMGRNN